MARKAATKKATRKTSAKAAPKKAAAKASPKKAARKKATRKQAAKAAPKKATRKTSSRKRRPPRVPAEHVASIVQRLAEHDPHPRCALDHANPFELVAATILSAQCTDERVNMVTPQLFARWPTPAALGAAAQEDVEEVIHSTGFFRNKARSLIGMARRVHEAFGDEVPQGMDDLLSLPGVARKTANVVRGECWGLADGVVVDTHVNRISTRIGFSKQTDPVQVERDLMHLVPRDHWIAFSHRLIRLGRTACPARKPRCDECPLAGLCPRVGV